MRSTKTRSFAFALSLGAGILGLSACAGVRWQKAGADEAALTKDLAECRRQAQTWLGIAGGFGPPNAMDPRFGAPSGPTQADRMMQESQATGACMHQRGYVLVPS